MYPGKAVFPMATCTIEDDSAVHHELSARHDFRLSQGGFPRTEKEIQQINVYQDRGSHHL